LEFDQIVNRIAELAVSRYGQDRIFALQPLNDMDAIADALTRVSEMCALLEEDSGIPLQDVGDLDAIFKKSKLAGSVLFAEDCVQVYHFAVCIRRLNHYFSTHTASTRLLSTIFSRFQPTKSLEDTLLRCIDPSTFEIKDNASPALASIRKKIATAQTTARRKMESKMRALSAEGILQENLVAVRNGRLVLVVKDEFKRKVKGLVHDQSATGASLFIEPLDVVADNNYIRELMVEESREIEKILRSLTDDIRIHSPLLDGNLEAFGETDFYHAQARFSKLIHGHQPDLVQEPILSLKDARHPLLVLRLGYQLVVPLDLSLGEKFFTMVISGPNAGGKTVALKTVGLLTLMTLCGIHIPVSPQSRIGMIHQIFAVIGDQQSLENDLSTFSSHVQQLAAISSKADQHSLVLIDEITAGTDPDEGSALAIAFLEQMTRRKCLTITTTHSGVLKSFAYRTDGIENASLEFAIATLQPTYKFRTTIPGSSYAFEIAKRMGLAAELIDRARAIVGTQKNELEGLIFELDEKIQSYSRMIHEADSRESEFRTLNKEYEEKINRLTREIKAIKRQAAEEAENLMLESNAAIERAIREIKETQAAPEAVKSVRNDLAEQQQKIEQIKSENIEMDDETPVGHFSIGDRIIWTKNKNSGIVLSAADKKERVMVQFDGGIKILLPLSELRAGKHKSPAQQPIKVNLQMNPSAIGEIDLRGKLSEEALDELAKYLDQAIMMGLNQVSIIHGKGTGKLRTAVSDFLRQHSQIQGFRLGNWNEGNSGVTIAYFKGSNIEIKSIDE